MGWAAVLLVFVVTVASARASEPALSFMRGMWQGEGLMLFLDTEHMQANTSADKPFQREPLVIRNIADRMVVFDIGARRYIGLFKGNELQLSGGEGDKVVRLRRVARP